ncbi:hypothetical protein EJ02DRAFT_400651 [Clathrospora elynae]|uniref:Zn(2)-C6 fungal-type domain-containing protein n=1 Tax=Clathrospora elynae TaxID=706981 RepID=A0A6A5SXS0_9PLEO|nr:hypothetical protein EJ02DRAFT_400651 [Clathrospora elynae]
MDRVGDSKQRFSKSRNGMSVFTKPTCEKCARRRITCGGYKIDVRWKQAPDPKKQSPPRRSRCNPSSRACPLSAIIPSTSDQEVQRSRSNDEEGNEARQPQLPYSSTSEDMMDLAFLNSDIGPPSVSFPTPRSLDSLMQDFDQTSARMPQDQLSYDPNASPERYGQIYIGEHPPTECIDYSSELWNMESFWEDYLRPTTNISLDPGLSPNDTPVTPETARTREFEAESTAYLFLQQTCHTFSIQEESDQNPWRTLIWPLAKEHPALWHAIAALTCFGMCRQQPQLRPDGARHVLHNTELFLENMNQGEVPLDVALAATLAFGFAETWDYETARTGVNHIRIAEILLSQLLSNRARTVLGSGEEARLEFLYNTWTYMDVLARFTCNDTFLSYSTNTPIPHWSELGWTTCNLDPLMGYSTTFFPIMRRVANLINKVRARTSPRNSPAIISQGLDLKRSIEAWTPPIDLETVDDPSPNMTDAIQTAEAYRWSTLCLLYQAVPELPNLTSYGELAQKILVYLATIPTNSTTMIVHILPLMVAGCDTVEEEDRDFVRERWKAISARMPTSVASRCINITEEVWRRREEYLCTRGLSISHLPHISITSIESAALSQNIVNSIILGSMSSPGAPSDIRNGQNGQVNVRKGKVYDFPISAAFKKGVDGLTRSGCTEYTVRGRLHWLGVMSDWDCHVMLG